MARYFTEYIFWLFSGYMNKNKIDKIDDSVLNGFAKSSIVVIPDFKYGNVPKLFSLNSGIMKDEKLVVTSQDMLKRLLYVLKLYTIRDLKTLRNYHTVTAIMNYYEDITDFDSYSFQVILQGEDAVDKWIQENKMAYTLYNRIIIGQKTPYFFKNELVENRVFLAQNTITLQQAMDVAVTWYKQKYNIGLYSRTETELEYGFTLYSYVNSSNITKVNVESTKDSDFHILGYKIENRPFYTVLLDL
jgi:hypothetical protein